MSKSREKKKEAVLIPEIVSPVLSRRHESVIVALLANPTMKDAATAAGVSESTVWRLMQREDFQKRYREAQDKALDGALGALQGAATLAISALKRNLDCGTPAAEVQAAKVLLDYTLKVREQFDYAARLKQLEMALKAREEAERRLGTKEKEEDEDED
ncbi:MAG TPA: transposase family protein [Pyrinomonadaceae bacterium]|jgi:DNA-binding MurR/RpiR family transcriptional regulator